MRGCGAEESTGPSWRGGPYSTTAGVSPVGGGDPGRLAFWRTLVESAFREPLPGHGVGRVESAVMDPSPSGASRPEGSHRHGRPARSRAALGVCHRRGLRPLPRVPRDVGVRPWRAPSSVTVSSPARSPVTFSRCASGKPPEEPSEVGRERRSSGSGRDVGFCPGTSRRRPGVVAVGRGGPHRTGVVTVRSPLSVPSAGRRDRQGAPVTAASGGRFGPGAVRGRGRRPTSRGSSSAVGRPGGAHRTRSSPWAGTRPVDSPFKVA